MGKKFLKAFVIMISSFAASIGLEACNGSSVGNNTSNVSTTSNPTSSNSTVPTTDTPTTSDSTTSNSTTDTPTSSSTPSTSTPSTEPPTTTVPPTTVPPTTEDHSHKYDQQVVGDIYKASDADCEHAATYYYSCTCGDRCSETFEHGRPLGHSYSNWSYHYRETVDGEDKKARTCSRCNHVEVVTLTDSQSVQNLIFEIISEDQKTCKIVGYSSFYDDERDNNIVIPEIWNGYKVITISEQAFAYCSSLLSIFVPSSVINIIITVTYILLVKLMPCYEVIMPAECG